uniref:Neurofascin/L1/NrCAM C-terminal domain-containing protein n=1 Tax=Arion vulgaris TaxID=1028688 RepID=A0A0B7B4G9_9EUPU
MGQHTDPSKFQLSNGNRTLTVLKVQKATDILCVQCEVVNHVDTTWADACLNVILPIRVLTRPSEEQNIDYGDVIHLTITATTDPSMALSYRWEFNNETGPSYVPPFMDFDSTTMLGYINTSKLTEAQYDTVGGVYRRYISHTYQNEVVEIRVTLKDKPVVAGVAAASVDMWIIGLIIGILFLLIVIIIIIFVICRKKQEGDYNVDKKETGAGLNPKKELKDKGFNDYSRPDYDDYDSYPDKKPRGDLEYDDVPIGGDDESLGEYGDEDDTHFNEDGSFIGIYQKKQQPSSKAHESTI